MDSNFIDYVKICFRSGAGGAGCMHFHRDKNTSKGGPDGGDGGRGGHIILRGSHQHWTLIHLKYRKHVLAHDGIPGNSSNQTGARGEDIILDVPLGTIVKDAETGNVEFEIVEEGQTYIVAPGGRGGLGNGNFKNSVNQAPSHHQPGEPGREDWKILELKVLADVGFVGFPNAGKSTLLSVMSAAKPEIADYAFTTLVPNLGIVKYGEYKSFIAADIPGIIEGASEGRGLGHRFLRHIERNSILLFVIAADSDDIKKEYEVLMSELEKYNPELLDKKKILAINKSDMLDEELEAEMKKLLPKKVPYIFISALKKQGIDKLKDMLWKELNS
jgi:GTP-binding protein